MTSLMDLHPANPLHVSCGPIELQLTRVEDIPELVDLAAEGIHAPDGPMPFMYPWHQAPADELPLNTLQHHALTWATFSAEKWALSLVVRRCGEIVGMQDVGSADNSFRATRSAVSGSWLGMKHQGRGTGTLMRQTMATLAFDHLGVGELHSAYVDGNHASAAVSRKTGYVDNGVKRIARDDTWILERAIRLIPEALVRPPWDVVVTGVEPLRRFLLGDD